MKYYTRELWQLAQDARTVEEYDNRWQDAHERYMRQLSNLRSRIDNDAYGFFSDADVHDGELLKFIVEDGSRPAPLSQPVRPWNDTTGFPVKATLRVLDSADKFIWSISYSKLRRVMLDYPTSDPLFYREGEGFGDWGYHELTDAGGGFLRHEILFATGSTLVFEFVDIAVTRTERSLV
jgi:hypothetical protein